jgi:hypothetical protein
MALVTHTTSYTTLASRPFSSNTWTLLKMQPYPLQARFPMVVCSGPPQLSDRQRDDDDYYDNYDQFDDDDDDDYTAMLEHVSQLRRTATVLLKSKSHNGTEI